MTGFLKHLPHLLIVVIIAVCATVLAGLKVIDSSTWVAIIGPISGAGIIGSAVLAASSSPGSAGTAVGAAAPAAPAKVAAVAPAPQAQAG